MRRFVLFLVILGLFMSPRSTRAAGVVGNGTAASCTETALRNAVAGGGLVTFNCGPNPVTISLNSELRITTNTEINGGGSAQGGLITLSGGNKTRVLATQQYIALTVRNLTIANGKDPNNEPDPPYGRAGGIKGGWRSPITVINSKFLNNDGTAGAHESGGGAIFVHVGSLNVSDSYFSGNRGSNGGAINNMLGPLVVSNSLFENNDSTAGANFTGRGEGGAIYTDGASASTNDAIGGSIIIRDSVFRNNRAAGQGGALFTFVYPPDTVTIERVTLENNVVDRRCFNGTCESFGGGLRHGNGNLTLRDSLFIGNTVREQGGGFWAGELGTWNLTNITFVNNQAVRDPATGKGGLGGALAGMQGWHCVNCTFVNNRAGYVGGAIHSDNTTQSSLRNSIFVGNTAFNDGNPWNIKHTCSGTVASGGGNVQFPAATPGGFDANCVANAKFQDPLVGTLGNYGGATRTIPLAANSPARNYGVNCPTTDQRGLPRPSSACDSGAFQTQSLNVSSVSPGLIKRNQATTLTVFGTAFTSNSVVTWDGVDLPTTFVNELTLVAQVNSSQTAGSSATVRVRNGSTTTSSKNIVISETIYTTFIPLTQR